MTPNALIMLALCLVGLAVCAPAIAQEAPAFIPVQGTLTNDDGTPKDGSFVLEFRLYPQENGGTAFYAERQPVTVEEGLFTAYLGDGTPADLGDGATSAPLDLSLFAARPLGVAFLGIRIDDDPELRPRLQLGSVPFAAHAQTCGDATTLAGRSASDFAPLVSGKVNASVLPETYAKATHTHSADQVPNLEQLHGKLTTSQLPNGEYLQEGRFAWGRVMAPDPGIHRDDPGVLGNGTPTMGSVTVGKLPISCSGGVTPQVLVSVASGGWRNFVAWAVRWGDLDGDKSLNIDWVNLYNESTYAPIFDWLAFCP